jgi:hypothetical protein
MPSVLLIEHDMSVAMSVSSDSMYCLEAGRIISEGRPRPCGPIPYVVESYLGTGARSGLGADALSTARIGGSPPVSIGSASPWPRPIRRGYRRA